jgi:hypothetical protein
MKYRLIHTIIVLSNIRTNIQIQIKEVSLIAALTYNNCKMYYFLTNILILMDKYLVRKYKYSCNISKLIADYNKYIKGVNQFNFMLRLYLFPYYKKRYILI